MAGDTEATYRAGVERWAAGDLDGAAGLFDQALAASPGPDADDWWFAVSRARAQVAMARDELDAAEGLLARLPDDLIGAAQSLALAGRLAWLRGDELEAATMIQQAEARIGFDTADDIGSLMNGAIALVSGAEVLVELGFGEDALRLLSAVRMRVLQAGVDDPAVQAAALLVAAGAARLLGEPASAALALARLDPTVSFDLPAQAARMRARLAHDAGDHEASRRHYDDAVAAASAVGDRSFVRLVEAERVSGPPVVRSIPTPDLPAGEQLGYAVVLTLAVDRPIDQFFALDAEVCDLVDGRPELGLVDGNGTDGEVFELFLDGDDPHELWAAIRPIIDAFGPAAGSRVVLTPVDAEPTEIAL